MRAIRVSKDRDEQESLGKLMLQLVEYDPVTLAALVPTANQVRMRPGRWKKPHLSYASLVPQPVPEIDPEREDHEREAQPLPDPLPTKAVAQQLIAEGRRLLAEGSLEEGAERFVQGQEMLLEQ
jgi:hypothetical protein